MKYRSLFMVALGLGLCLTGAPVLGNDFYVIDAAQASPLRTAKQLVYLSDTITQDGPNININLSTIKRVNENGVLTTFSIPTGQVFVLETIILNYYVIGKIDNYESSYVNIKIGNYYYNLYPITIGYEYGQELNAFVSRKASISYSFSPGLAISPTGWNSNAIILTVDNRAGIILQTPAKLKVIMTGYLAPF
jgi:hypothetical protein